jgi:hypothetical protein
MVEGVPALAGRGPGIPFLCLREHLHYPSKNICSQKHMLDVESICLRKHMFSPLRAPINFRGHAELINHVCDCLFAI